METGRIHDELVLGLLLGAEENRGGEDPLEGGLHSAVLSSVLGEVEIIEQLSWTLKVNSPALLFQGLRGHPDGNQAILPIRQSKSWMSRNLKNEVAVCVGSRELVWGRPAQRKSAENERPGVV